MQVNRASKILAVVALVVGFAFVVPPASAADDGADAAETDVAVTQAIPPCASNPEVDAGYARVGLDYFCNPYVEEDLTDRCRVNDGEPTLVLVECQLSSATDADDLAATQENQCFYIYWKHRVGPVVWEQRSSCDGEIYVDDDWRALGEVDASNAESLVAEDLATAEGNCPAIYWKWQIGPVVWEQRSGCDGEIYVDSSWRPTAVDGEAASAPGLSTTQDHAHCLDIYSERDVGPVKWEQRSSCHGEIYIDENWRP